MSQSRFNEEFFSVGNLIEFLEPGPTSSPWVHVRNDQGLLEVFWMTNEVAEVVENPATNQVIVVFQKNNRRVNCDKLALWKLVSVNNEVDNLARKIVRLLDLVETSNRGIDKL